MLLIEPSDVSKILCVVAVIHFQTICAHRLFFCALSSALFAVETAVPRALGFRRHTLVLSGPQTPLALVAGRLCFVTLDLFLAAPNAGLILAEPGRRGWLLERRYFLGRSFGSFQSLSFLSLRLLARLCGWTGTIALAFSFH